AVPWVARAAKRGMRLAGPGMRRGVGAPREGRAAGRRHWGCGRADACPQRLRALDPARHADGPELLARDVEEHTRPVPIPVRPAPDLHPGLVEVDERAQRPRALLVEDGAGPLEPVVRLIRTSRERAELRHRQARIDAKIAE